MNYKEEQNTEMEALESIYYGDLKTISINPFHKFTVFIKSEEYEPETGNGLAVSLTFTFTKKYPEKPPLVNIFDFQNLTDNNKIELKEYITKLINKNLGTVMIFNLVSESQEWLNVKWEQIRKEREDNLFKKQQEEKEAERKRLENAQVTVESFLKWKTKFEEETGIVKKRKLAEKRKKLTGKQQFLTDKNMYKSDLKFLDDRSGIVNIDESLFQDLNDLDLDSED